MKRYIYATEDYDPELAFSGDPKVRAQVAQTTASPELLEIYACDPKAMVQEAAAKNPNMSIKGLGDILSSACEYDRKYEVLRAVAQELASRNPTIDELSILSSKQFSTLLEPLAQTTTG